MPTAHINHINVYFERAGSGDPLLFISGSHGDLRNRPNQFDTVLAERFDLISYDQRGLGQTDNPPGEFTMVDYAEDAATLLAHLDVGSVPVVGVSFGGMVAQELAVRYPEQVSKLVLACTSSGGAGGASYPLQDFAKLPPEERAIAQIRQADLRHDEAWAAANPERWQRLVGRSPRAGRGSASAW